MKETGSDINSIANIIRSRNNIVSDEELREKHPALQAAWDQYQVIYKLCKEERCEQI